jgi:galactonate dehydratase
MQIRAIEQFAVGPRWLFVKVDTDEGVTGWGEATPEGHGEAVSGALSAFAPTMIGQDPLRIEDHWQRLTKSGFYRGGPVLASAVAGIDQALWDIAGKALGVPVYRLLAGPVRDRVRMYGWVAGDDPTEVAEHTQRQLATGLTAVKMNASGRMSHLPTPAATADVVARAAAARAVLRPHLDFALDFHGRLSAPAARRLLTHLAEYHPLFVEEPVLPEYTATALARVIAGTSVPIATGERLYSRGEFLPALQAGIAVAQPDVSHAGGVSEVRRIAALAETFNVALAPHCPLGPIALAACLQVDFATPNFLIQEQSLAMHYNQGGDLLDYLLDRSAIAVQQGHAHRTDRPGLGIDVDEPAVRRAAEVYPGWRTPLWRHADGSLAEW